jgi:hypothetical protein
MSDRSALVSQIGLIQQQLTRCPVFIVSSGKFLGQIFEEGTVIIGGRLSVIKAVICLF